MQTIFDWFRKSPKDPFNPNVEEVVKATAPTLPRNCVVRVCKAIQQGKSTVQNNEFTAFIEKTEKCIRVFVSFSESAGFAASSQGVQFFKAHTVRFSLEGTLITKKYTVKEIVQMTLPKSQKETTERIAIMKQLANKTLFPKNYAFFGNVVMQERAEKELFEMFDSGELHKLPETTRHEYALQLIAAVAEIHENGIVHRDLKLENILLCNGRVKITDFGLAKFASDQEAQKTLGGTLHFCPPEVVYHLLANKPKPDFDQKLDIWALGLLIEMLLSSDALEHQILLCTYNDLHHNSKAPDKEEQKAALFADWEVCIKKLPQEPPKELKTLDDVKLAMLQVDPVKRITAKAALEALQKK